jgi:hypothetical protein
MNRSRDTASAVFHRFFWPRKPFKMSISKKLPQVLILNNLLEMLNLLECAFTGKGGGGGAKRPGGFRLRAREIPSVIATRLQLRVEEETQRKGEQRERLDEHET